MISSVRPNKFLHKLLYDNLIRHFCFNLYLSDILGDMLFSLRVFIQNTLRYNFVVAFLSLCCLFCFTNEWNEKKNNEGVFLGEQFAKYKKTHNDNATGMFGIFYLNNYLRNCWEIKKVLLLVTKLMWILQFFIFCQFITCSQNKKAWRRSYKSQSSCNIEWRSQQLAKALIEPESMQYWIENIDRISAFRL